MWKLKIGNCAAYALTWLFLLMVAAVLAISIYVTFFLTALIAQAAPISPNQACLNCHGNPGLNVKRDGQDIKLYLNPEQYTEGVHGQLDCTTCHSAIKGVPHQNPVYDQALWQEVKPACNSCHSGPTGAFQQSIHTTDATGKCASCHGNLHYPIPSSDPAAPVAKTNVSATCSSCHDGVVKESYQRSFHGIALNFGYDQVPSCVDCHDSHNITSVNNPESRVAPDQVGKVCASCHGGEASANWGNGKEHVLQEDRDNALALWITWKLFLLLILFDIIKDGGLVVLELLHQLRHLRRKESEDA